MNITWQVVYEDGSIVNQYNDDGTENKYFDIYNNKIVYFKILKNSKVIFVLHLDRNKRLIYRRRVALNINTGEEEVVYIVGFQENKNGVNVQSIAFIFEDGHIELIDRFKENHKWFYPIEFLPEERI